MYNITPQNFNVSAQNVYCSNLYLMSNDWNFLMFLIFLIMIFKVLYSISNKYIFDVVAEICLIAIIIRIFIIYAYQNPNIYGYMLYFIFLLYIIKIGFPLIKEKDKKAYIKNKIRSYFIEEENFFKRLFTWNKKQNE